MVECLACRFRYLDPPPADDELARFYSADYPAYTLQLKPNGKTSREQASLNRRLGRVARKRIRLIRRCRPAPWDGLRVLDIGCGNGAFLLELLRQYPVEAWGLDLSEDSLAPLRQLDPRLRLVAGDLFHADLPAGYFDVITMWHVLEHTADPVENLRKVGRLLKPGGLLLAEVPNSAGLIARICGPYWLGWDLPRHLVHFTPRTLRETAARAGGARVRVLRRYTLNPITLSPLLASLALRRQRRKGRTRMKRVPYHRCDGLPGTLLRLVNGLEWLLGGNGLLLAARWERQEVEACATCSGSSILPGPTVGDSSFPSRPASSSPSCGPST